MKNNYFFISSNIGDIKICKFQGGGGSAHVAFQPGNHRSSSKAKTEKMLFIVICGLVELCPERIRVCISTVSDILFLNLKFDLKTIFPKTQIVKTFVANNIAIYSN